MKLHRSALMLIPLPFEVKRCMVAGR